MSELKEIDEEKYNLLILNKRIHFEEDGISLNLYRSKRIKIDRKNSSWLFWWTIFTLEKAKIIAEKEWKK